MFDCEFAIGRVLEELRRGFECQKIGEDRISLITPFSTVDGDALEVVVTRRPDGDFSVTDMGEATRYLGTYDLDLEDSMVRKEYLEQIKCLLNVSFHQGRINVIVAEDELGSAVIRVIEAFKFIADMVYTAKPREESELMERVKGFIFPMVRRLTTNEELNGRSGKKHKIDFYGLNEYGVFVEVISGQRRGSFNSKLLSSFVAWSDADPTVRKLTIIDDQSKLAEPSDYELIRSVSVVSSWSDKEDIQRKIKSLTALRL